MMSNAFTGVEAIYALRINGQLKPQYYWTQSGGNVPNTVYNKLLKQQTNSANLIPAGEIMGSGLSWYCVKISPGAVCAKCANR